MFGDDAGDAPVRHLNSDLRHINQVVKKEFPISHNAQDKKIVAKVSRNELEDRYLRLHEENLILKQHTHQQEDKIKRMATKLMRLVNDRKHAEQTSSGGRIVKGQDFEMREMNEELQEKVRKLEKQKEGLRQHLLTAKMQLQTQSHRPSPYSHIQPRINSGLRRMRDEMPQWQITPKGGPRYVKGDFMSAGPRYVKGDFRAKPPQPYYIDNLLNEARSEIRRLENVIENQRSQMDELERSEEILRDQLRTRERKQQANNQRSTIKDNVEMIRLQKKVVEKENAFSLLERKYFQLDEDHETLKISHKKLLAKADELAEQLKEERLKRIGLETQLRTKIEEEKGNTEANHQKLMLKVEELTKQLKEERQKILGLEAQLCTRTEEESRTTEKFLAKVEELTEQLKEERLKSLALETQLHTKTEEESRITEENETLKANHEKLLAKVDELTIQLKEERLKSLSLEAQLHTKTEEQSRATALHEGVHDLKMERDLHKENVLISMNSALVTIKKRKTTDMPNLRTSQLDVTVNAEEDLNKKLLEQNEKPHYLEQKHQLNQQIKATTDTSEEEEYECDFSDGQVTSVSSRSESDVSEICEVPEEPEEVVPEPPCTYPHSPSPAIQHIQGPGKTKKKKNLFHRLVRWIKKK